jgi:hypothetical protein
MHPSAPPRRGRLVAAIVVSLSLHSLIGLAWLTSRDPATTGGPGVNVVVDGPDLRETVVVLLDRRPEPKPKVSVPPTETPKTTPSPLPGSLTRPPEAGVDTASHSAPSPVVPVSLPKSTGPKPIHGKLRSGQTVVYLLDRSSSMGVDGLLARAVATLKASLDQLGPDVRFQIVAYNSGTTSLASEPVPAIPANAERAAAWLQDLIAEGASDHKAGFHEALRCRPDLVVLLTDADDLEWRDVRAINAMLRTPVVIWAAVFGGPRPAADSPLAGLVNRTGGSVQYVRGE